MNRNSVDKTFLQTSCPNSATVGFTSAKEVKALTNQSFPTNKTEVMYNYAKINAPG